MQLHLAEFQVMVPMKYLENSVADARVGGTNQDYIKTTNLEIEEGSFITEIESNGARRVIVLGYELSEKLFPSG